MCSADAPISQNRSIWWSVAGFVCYIAIINYINLIDIKPFYLWALPEQEAYLCPVRALAEWIHESKIKRGYIFRKMNKYDQPASEENAAMVRGILCSSLHMRKINFVECRKVLGILSKQLD